jgi:hypothetical protein
MHEPTYHISQVASMLNRSEIWVKKKYGQLDDIGHFQGRQRRYTRDDVWKLQAEIERLNGKP